MARYFLINKYFVEVIKEAHQEVCILWRSMAASDERFWLERMGDKLVREIKKENFIKKYYPIKGDLIEAELKLIDENDLGQIRPWIYDLIIYPEGDGAWYGINQSSIHLNKVERTLRKLKVKEI